MIALAERQPDHFDIAVSQRLLELGDYRLVIVLEGDEYFHTAELCSGDDRYPDMNDREERHGRRECSQHQSKFSEYPANEGQRSPNTSGAYKPKSISTVQTKKPKANKANYTCDDDNVGNTPSLRLLVIVHALCCTVPAVVGIDF